MEIVRCPICDKRGIPDFHKKNVICPHCSSDLSIYKTIYEATQSQFPIKEPKVDRRKVNMFVSITILSLCLIASSAFISYNISRKPLLMKIESQNIDIKSLNESLILAQAKENPDDSKSVQVQFIYVIQKYDSPWSIVRKLFGVTSDWKAIGQKIAENNGIWDSEKKAWKEIHPGQKLAIYNNN